MVSPDRAIHMTNGTKTQDHWADVIGRMEGRAPGPKAHVGPSAHSAVVFGDAALRREVVLAETLRVGLWLIGSVTWRRDARSSLSSHTWGRSDICGARR